MIRWRFLDTGARSGKFNMDLDLQLAQELYEGRHGPTLRLYQWEPYCISLGKHQKNNEINAKKCEEDGIDIVWRPTGGRAVLHAEELTYSLVLPLELGAEYVSSRISRALVKAMTLLGVEAAIETHPANLKSWYLQPTSTLCFSSSTRNELQVRGRKLIGSAQRILDGVILQHGSILIGPSHMRIVEYLNLDPSTKEDMATILRDKTTCLSEWGVSDLSAIKSAVRGAFEDIFGVTTRDAGKDVGALNRITE